jgi:YWFCY protein/Type IV secretory system Conjugative DNA transfer
MAMQTGENEEALTRVIDLIRMTGIIILLLHFYSSQYPAFQDWGLSGAFTDAIMNPINDSGLIQPAFPAKSIALVLLFISLLGARGKKDPAQSLEGSLRTLGGALALYFASGLILCLELSSSTTAILYMALSSMGYALILSAGTRLSRIIFRKTEPDLFNRLHESFPQEETLISNPHSINLRARYEYQGIQKDSWINIVNPFRGCLLAGNPGSMKTVGFVEPFIKQEIAHGFSMLIYDFKFDDLSKIAYNYFLKYRDRYPEKASFHTINFDDLRRTSRCNPLHPSILRRMPDAAEAARSILLGLNPDWMSKAGDFWVESSVNLVTALIWWLRKYQDGKYCSWAHVIELAATPHKELFAILRAQTDIQTLINPFIDAFLHNNFDQLDGQTASAKIGLARLALPSLYYVLTGNDFSLELNDPDQPTILCLGNSPQNSTVYGALFSVYINTINRIANKKGRLPLGIILDECTSVVATSLDKTLASGRSNLMAFLIVIQDISQLKLAYGKPYADVLFNVCGNYFCGQATGDTAREFSERFGKSMQDRESINIGGTDTSITQSAHLENLIPVSRITSLSSGEFVGMVADNPDQPIPQKAFCARLQVDLPALQKEKDSYVDLPVIREVTEETLQQNYRQIKKDIARLITEETDRIGRTPELRHLLIP